MSAATSIVAATPRSGWTDRADGHHAGLFRNRTFAGHQNDANQCTVRIRTHTAIRVVAGRATGAASRADGYYFPDPLSWEHTVRAPAAGRR